MSLYLTASMRQEWHCCHCHATKVLLMPPGCPPMEGWPHEWESRNGNGYCSIRCLALAVLADKNARPHIIAQLAAEASPAAAPMFSESSHSFSPLTAIAGKRITAIGVSPDLRAQAREMFPDAAITVFCGWAANQWVVYEAAEDQACLIGKDTAP